MERHRGGGGDRYPTNSDPHHYYSRPSTRGEGGGPPPPQPLSAHSPYTNSETYNHRPRSRSPISDNYRGRGGGGDHLRAFDSPPRYPPHHPPSGNVRGGGVFRPVGGGGGGFSPNQSMPPPPHVAGQKRGYPFSDRKESPTDRSAGGSFAKLFVGSVPRTATEEDIRRPFADHGNVLEVALIRDKRTGQQQGCCFIKYATSGDADRAIRALHNQYTLPGGVGPIQVRYADGERERLGAVEYKLFVGSLNKLATEKEVEEVFTPYGQVEDVYLMRDDMKQSRGCGFVKYSHKEMALAAINALNGTYTMRGCDQPLIVRFADPKRPRAGERVPPTHGDPGLEHRFPAPGIRPASGLGESMHGQIPPNAWQIMSPQNLGQPHNAGPHSLGNQFPPRSGGSGVSSTPGTIPGSFGKNDGSNPGLAVSSATMTQSSLPQVPYAVNQISPLQKPAQSPQYLPPSLQSQNPVTASFAQTQTFRPPPGPTNQLQMSYSSGQNTFNQALPSQQLNGMNGQLSASQAQGLQNASPATAQTSVNTHSQSVNMSMGNPQQQLVQPHHPSPSQLAQLLSQQTQTLQASFQSSQQAFSQLQQQLQLMQPNPGLMAQQGLQTTKQQTPWAGNVPQTVANTPAVQPGGVPAATPTSAGPSIARTSAPVKPNWTEHTSPDGFKYYYSSSTGESKWEKPEELLLYEKQQQEQQQKPPVQQLQMQSQPQNPLTNHVPLEQVPNQLQMHVHSQFRPPQMLQQSSHPSLYQVPAVRGPQNLQELGYSKLPAATGSVNDQTRMQQGPSTNQDWMWKNRPAGS